MDADKLEMTLTELQAEKSRRLQAAVEAGSAIVLQPWVIVGERGRTPTDAEIEAAKAQELARFQHENPGDGRTVHLDVVTICTGVVRSPEFGKNARPTSSPDAPIENIEQAAPPEPPRQPTEKQYVRAQIEPGDDDGYPGRIAEGRYWTEFDMDPEGRCVVESMTGEFVGGRSLHGQDAALIARQILKAAHARYKRLDYPHWGVV